jgi:hypothetical protein
MTTLEASINLIWSSTVVSTPSIRFVAKKFVPVFQKKLLSGSQMVNTI